MSRTRRLSLRARMLVMLIGVTTVLLLVMGTVSTYLFVRRVDAQVALASKNLVLRAKELPEQLASLRHDPTAVPPGDAVVEVPLRAFAAIPLTSGTLTKQLAQAVEQRLDTPAMIEARAPAMGRATAIRVVEMAGCAGFPHLGCAFTLDGKIRVASALRQTGTAGRLDEVGLVLVFIGEPVSTAPSQVRGFIIAELITGTALIALLALAGEWLIGRGLIPLDEMTRTANEITSQGDLTARMPDADDQTEVGRLGSSINTMLDRIQQAFSSRLRSEQKVREFAADASHELRTPLTTIRGYAELYRQGALGPDQLPNAMRRIEQEAERMSTLVAELLELARLDRTSSLDLTETDLAGVVRDAVADAIAVEPRRPVHAEAPPRLVAVVDEPRIRQVLANLLGNVRAHTPVTTPVAVRLGAITGGVLIEVADAGPGMSTQDAIRAFDRFHRATDRPPAADYYDAAGEDQDQGGNAREPASALPGGAAAQWLGGAWQGAAARRASVNGAGVNGADVNGTGADGASVNGASVNGASVNGAGINSASVDAIRPYPAEVDAVQLNGAAGNGDRAADHGAANHGAANHGAANDNPNSGAVRNGAASGQGRHRSPGGPGRAERTSGSGLGLSIVQAIANAHGGRATLESLPGKGTKVRVWLPVRIVP
jgi:signal transduction histidine kinase